MSINGRTVVTGELADGVIAERERYLKLLIDEMPKLAERAVAEQGPLSIDSLILAMTAYIGMWINKNLEQEALKQHMVATVSNALHLVCGYEVETEFLEPAERQEH